MDSDHNMLPNDNGTANVQEDQNRVVPAAQGSRLPVYVVPALFYFGEIPADVATVQRFQNAFGFAAGSALDLRGIQLQATHAVNAQAPFQRDIISRFYVPAGDAANIFDFAAAQGYPGLFPSLGGISPPFHQPSEDVNSECVTIVDGMQSAEVTNRHNDRGNNIMGTALLRAVHAVTLAQEQRNSMEPQDPSMCTERRPMVGPQGRSCMCETCVRRVTSAAAGRTGYVANRASAPPGRRTTPYRRRQPSRSSEYRGVNYYQRTGRWEAHIWTYNEEPQRQLYLGASASEEEAARAYDRAGLVLGGEAFQDHVNFQPAQQYEADVKRLQKLTRDQVLLFLRRDSKGPGAVLKYPCVKKTNGGRFKATYRKDWSYRAAGELLGTFRSEEEAARAVCERAVQEYNMKLARLINDIALVRTLPTTAQQAAIAEASATGSTVTDEYVELPAADDEVQSSVTSLQHEFDLVEPTTPSALLDAPVLPHVQADPVIPAPPAPAPAPNPNARADQLLRNRIMATLNNHSIFNARIAADQLPNSAIGRSGPAAPGILIEGLVVFEGRVFQGFFPTYQPPADPTDPADPRMPGPRY